MATASTGISISASFYNYNTFFDVCEINGSKFALFSKSIQSSESINIDLNGYNVVFLKPLEAEGDIFVKAVTVVALTSLTAKHGAMNVAASGKFIALGAQIESEQENKIVAVKDILTYGIIKQRLDMILKNFNDGVLSKEPMTILDALYETFDAIEDPEGENETINVRKALEFFEIPTGS